MTGRRQEAQRGGLPRAFQHIHATRTARVRVHYERRVFCDNDFRLQSQVDESLKDDGRSEGDENWRGRRLRCSEFQKDPALTHANLFTSGSRSIYRDTSKTLGSSLQRSAVRSSGAYIRESGCRISARSYKPRWDAAEGFQHCQGCHYSQPPRDHGSSQ